MLGSTIVRGGDEDPVVVGTCLEWVVCGPLLPPVSDPSCPSWSLPTQRQLALAGLPQSPLLAVPIRRDVVTLLSLSLTRQCCRTTSAYSVLSLAFGDLQTGGLTSGSQAVTSAIRDSDREHLTSQTKLACHIRSE
ncbi:hypothetical protein TSPI_08912 [Trichinella spiralis]|uniref:Uncharacterized protein n=1 Tax=Trichinella spiralis TaxID=6334 RepID=A0ABR3KGI7_TRISP